ncbi:hypothetical protein Q1Z72_01415 [Pseudomonas qingdaonensis]|uniref:hypothetical protein n=1 Tax=Pseudomonas TaxID=286 RepID=UPI002117D25C|nr:MULTISPECIES: hypothetical protein [Pseudomonas]UXH55943.1 hypothetical protein N5876_32875 [Pseudomonas aeruginosa]UXH68987.1 hypothetical protein N5879_32315 [Pseudomonas aeruginosa]WKL67353.1 hypothetical protein Q1Z72_01415 [Pseudomonas qingdaonensis]
MRISDAAALGMKGSFCPVTRSPSPNMTRSFAQGFTISYNSRSAGYGTDTTAIVLQERVFFVLSGDHAAALCAVADQSGIAGCVDYFIEHIAQANSHSEHLMATGVNADPFGLMPTALEVIGQDGVQRIVAAHAQFIRAKTKPAEIAHHYPGGQVAVFDPKSSTYDLYQDETCDEYLGNVDSISAAEF